MAVRVQGVASPERAALATGATADGARDRLEALAAAGLATGRSAALCGFSLTPAGLERLEELLAREGLRGDARLSDAYDRFLLVNERVLKACSDWQVRRDGRAEVPNDHTDPRYDASVIDRLCEAHARAGSCLEAFWSRAPRFGVYRSRLDDCVRRLGDGDRSAFTTPLAESYHTVWFELHQDLLLTLGATREG